MTKKYDFIMKAKIGDIILNHYVKENNGPYQKAIVISTNHYATRAIAIGPNNSIDIITYTPDFETNDNYERIGHVNLAEVFSKLIDDNSYC